MLIPGWRNLDVPVIQLGAITYEGLVSMFSSGADILLRVGNVFVM